MTITKIKKRNGEIVDFQSDRINRAIQKACDASDVECGFIDDVADAVVVDLTDLFDDRSHACVPTVEDVQDSVERQLVKINQYEVAKTYIIYRERHKKQRVKKHEKVVEQFEERSLKVEKLDGSREDFDITKIKTVFDRSVQGYEKECHFTDFIEALKKNLVEGIKTSDINKLMVKTCIDLVSINTTTWQHVGARVALGNLYKHATKNRRITMSDVYTPESYKVLVDEYIKENLYYKDFYEYYSEEDILTAGEHLIREQDEAYEYTTILSLSRRYLLQCNGKVKELPQEMYMSIALFLAIPEKKEQRLSLALKIYKHCSQQHISLPTPTLMNARTNYHQLSSCFVINTDDDLRAIYHSIENMAQISKYGGGVGVYLGNIRARGAAIRGVAGASGGVNPWIKVINNTATAVNQLGARIGAISVTLDMWHHDIYDFLDLQTETGDIRAKAFDIFPSLSIPDLFMQRIKDDDEWTLFDPHEIESYYGKCLQDYFNEDFEKFYKELEKDDRLVMKRTVAAKDLLKKFLKTTVETGMPYAFFRDTINRLNPNSHVGNIYATNLCTEICQNTAATTFVEEVIDGDIINIRYQPGDTVVCNLASVNIAKVHNGDTMSDVFPVLMRLLDNVITLNFYPFKEAERTAMRYRSVGVGYLGLAEYLATHKLAYESAEARAEAAKLFERFAYHTYRSSVDLAKERGHYTVYKGSKYDEGMILNRPVEWYEENTEYGDEWSVLFDDMKRYGVRFAYHTAPAPNTSTAGMVGTTAALTPIYKRYFVETNLSSPTVRVAPKLDKDNFWYYKEYVSMDMNDVIDMMSTIYPWIDQSISFEWMIDPAQTSPAQLYGYYMKAWKQGIKTVYYVRSLSGEIDPNTCTSCSG